MMHAGVSDHFCSMVVTRPGQPQPWCNCLNGGDGGRIRLVGSSTLVAKNNGWKGKFLRTKSEIKRRRTISEKQN